MITFDRYIRIISGVGAGSSVRRRDMILRILSTNPKLIPGKVYEVTNADAVANLASGGVASELYARALKYFGMVSKSINKPRALSIARYSPTASPSVWTGNPSNIAQTINDWKALGNTSLTLRLYSSDTFDPLNPSSSPSTPWALTCNFTSAADLAGVLTIINNAIQASSDPAIKAVVASASGTLPGNVVISLTNQSPANGSSKFSMINVDASNNAFANLIGANATANANASWQAPQQTPLEAISQSEAISNNFGSFCFSPRLSLTSVSPFSPEGASYDTGSLRKKFTDVAAWNATKDNMYMFLASVQPSELQPLAVGGSATGTSSVVVSWAPTIGLQGTALTVYNSTSDDFPEQCPGEIFAATNYDQRNATQSYMFYPFTNRTPVATDNTMADNYDAYRGNYIGLTQTGGQMVQFYQRGFLMGGANAALDMSVYANEVWLKDNIAVSVMNLLLNSGRVPVNEEGRAQIMSIIQTCVDQAKFNGTISVGKDLSTPDFAQQRQYITTATGDANAWRQVSTIGFWLDVQFKSYVPSTAPGAPAAPAQWKAAYRLIYAKDDSIRLVEGNDILI